MRNATGVGNVFQHGVACVHVLFTKTQFQQLKVAELKREKEKKKERKKERERKRRERDRERERQNEREERGIERLIE